MPARIEDCEEVITRMPREERILLEHYLRSRGVLRGRVRCLFQSCLSARLCQADLVLACLRLNLIGGAEALVGRPITRCPTVRPRSLPLARRAQRTGDARIVTSTREPRELERGRRRLLGCELYDRLARARVGMSVEMLLSRGITRRDLRIATKRKYLTIGG